MLVCILLALLAWVGGAIGDEDICKTRSHIACSIREHVRHYPRTEEDINRMCPFFAQYLECFMSYGEACGWENVTGPFGKERLQKLQPLVEDMCQKDSGLHLRIVENIGCVGQLLGAISRECGDKQRDKAGLLRKYTQDIERSLNEGDYDESETSAELWLPYQCVMESLGVACFVSDVSKRCGLDTQHLFLELLNRSGIMEEVCPSSISEERINEIIRVLELELEEERLLKDITNKH